ncbi:MAG TPA: phage terminase small subunit P27 family, partial [Candidatus Cybelea sp.]|nr:phage terminase small subunit P27 family [Candidatus Cybelea sp.]
RPMPTHLKLLRGNPSHQCPDELNRPEPKPELVSELPEPPSFLSDYAREEWGRVALELFNLRLLANIDIQSLAAYCQSYSRWRTAEETLAEIALRDPQSRGLLVKGGDAQPVQNPLIRIADRAAQQMVRYAAEFGLTPSARARIAAGVYSDGKTEKFAGLLAG